MRIFWEFFYKRHGTSKDSDVVSALSVTTPGTRSSSIEQLTKQSAVVVRRTLGHWGAGRGLLALQPLPGQEVEVEEAGSVVDLSLLDPIDARVAAGRARHALPLAAKEAIVLSGELLRVG